MARSAEDDLIEGWMGKKPRAWLIKQAKKYERLIEVGVWKGRTTRILAENTRGTVWAVDHWLGCPTDPAQHELLYGEADSSGNLIFEQFHSNLAEHIEVGRVVPVRMHSKDAARYLLEQHGKVFDFVFIDADHSYRGCLGDIESFRRLVKPGGIIAGHDFNWPGVRKAVIECLPLFQLQTKSVWSSVL